MGKYKQLIFIDDSGDPGFKFKRGSSRLFVIAFLDDYEDMNSARISLDGSGNRNFRKRSTTKIRQAVNKGSRKMAEFRLVDSRDSVLIQLADMVAGAIGAKYDKTKRFKHDYLRMLKSQIDDIQFLG